MPVNAMYYKSHKKKSIITHEYSLGQDKLSVVPSHPYVGKEIDNKLSWKQQLEKTKHKSIRTLNMVRRKVTKGTTSQIRNQIFTGLVRTTLEYGCIVWDPPPQTSIIQLLESVQNKGARYVTQDWDRHISVSQMKLSLGWCTLKERRLVNRLSFFHKSVHKYHRLELPPYVMKLQRISKNHHSHSFQNIRAQSDQYLHSFLPRTIRTWNLLPQDIGTAPSPDSYRSRLIKSIKDGTIVICGKCTGSRPSLSIRAFTKRHELFSLLKVFFQLFVCEVFYPVLI